MNYVANWLTIAEKSIMQFRPKANILFRHLVVRQRFHVYNAQLR